MKFIIYIINWWPFFCNFVNFKSIGTKYAYFLQIGDKICIFPLFSSPQHVIWPYFAPGPGEGGGVSNRKYTPLVFYLYFCVSGGGF